MRQTQAPHNTKDTVRDVLEYYRCYLSRNRDLADHCTQFMKRENSDPKAAEAEAVVFSWLRAEKLEPRVLSAISRGIGDGDDRPGGSYLPCELPLRLNRPTLQEVAVVTRAIHQQQVLLVKYHSLQRGTAKREVVPHALVDSGLRWHTRVFDRETGEFRDLVISRIEAAAPMHNGEILPHEIAQADEEWNRKIDLVLMVHPGVVRPEIVQRDFGMRRGELQVTVRAAIAGYVLQLWNVDCSADRRLDPAIHRLCLKNMKAIMGTKSLDIAPGFTKDVNEKL